MILSLRLELARWTDDGLPSIRRLRIVTPRLRREGECASASQQKTRIDAGSGMLPDLLQVILVETGGIEPPTF